MQLRGASLPLASPGDGPKLISMRIARRAQVAVDKLDQELMHLPYRSLPCWVKDGTGGNADRRQRRGSSASGDVVGRARLGLVREWNLFQSGIGAYEHD